MLRQFSGRLVRKIKDYGFRPYIKEFEIAGLKYRFFFGTKQASRWYDPPSKLAQIEYEWVLNNISLSNQKIIDGGCHHGHYSLVLGIASRNSEIISVDPSEMNIALTEVNLRLNQIEPRLIKSVISNKNGIIRFENVSNGKIVSTGGIPVNSKRLINILPDATIVKLDIEGQEFEVLDSQIAEMKSVHTWIIEVHTHHGDREKLLARFLHAGYSIKWVNPEKFEIEKFDITSNWNFHHIILFARK